MQKSHYILIFFLIITIYLSSCDNGTNPVVKRGSVSGTILDASDSKPLQNAVVQTIPLLDGAMTNEYGGFIINDLQVSVYVITAEKSNYYTNYFPVKIADGDTAEIEILLTKTVANNNIPLQPFNEKPKSGTSISADDVWLSWYSSDYDQEPLTYDIYLSRGELPHEIIVTGVSEKSYNLGNLEAGTYFWRVVCRDPYNAARLGEIWKFTVK